MTDTERTYLAELRWRNELRLENESRIEFLKRILTEVYGLDLGREGLE